MDNTQNNGLSHKRETILIQQACKQILSTSFYMYIHNWIKGEVDEDTDTVGYRNPYAVSFETIFRRGEEIAYEIRVYFDYTPPALVDSSRESYNTKEEFNEVIDILLQRCGFTQYSAVIYLTSNGEPRTERSFTMFQDGSIQDDLDRNPTGPPKNIIKEEDEKKKRILERLQKMLSRTFSLKLAENRYCEFKLDYMRIDDDVKWEKDVVHIDVIHCVVRILDGYVILSGADNPKPIDDFMREHLDGTNGAALHPMNVRIRKYLCSLTHTLGYDYVCIDSFKFKDESNS